MLTGLSFEIKAIICAITLALVGYSYYWTYSQGQKNGEANMVIVQAKAMLALQKSNALEAMKLREQELKEARETAELMNKDNQRKIADLKRANDLLKHTPAAAAIVPTDVIRLLNSAGRSSTPES